MKKINNMLEQFFFCPYCAEEISMLLDPSLRSQEYIEDCEVCCNPMEITAVFANRELVQFEVRELGQ